MGSSRLEIRHVQRNTLLAKKPAAVLSPDPPWLLPVAGFHGIPVFLQHHHMALFVIEGLRRPGMKHAEPSPDHVQLRRPKKISQMRIGIGIQNFHLLGRGKARYGIRLADINRMLMIQIVGGDKIIFPLPSSDAGIRLMPGHRKFIAVLMNPACDLVSTRPAPVNIPVIPVHSLFHTAAVTVHCRGLHRRKLPGRGNLCPLRHLIGNILRHQKPHSEPLRLFFRKLQHVSNHRPLRKCAPGRNRERYGRFLEKGLPFHRENPILTGLLCRKRFQCLRLHPEALSAALPPQQPVAPAFCVILTQRVLDHLPSSQIHQGPFPVMDQIL